MTPTVNFKFLDLTLDFASSETTTQAFKAAFQTNL
jgi:hypothetical protein